MYLLCYCEQCSYVISSHSQSRMLRSTLTCITRTDTRNESAQSVSQENRTHCNRRFCDVRHRDGMSGDSCLDDRGIPNRYRRTPHRSRTTDEAVFQLLSQWPSLHVQYAIEVTSNDRFFALLWIHIVLWDKFYRMFVSDLILNGALNFLHLENANLNYNYALGRSAVLIACLLLLLFHLRRRWFDLPYRTVEYFSYLQNRPT